MTTTFDVTQFSWWPTGRGSRIHVGGAGHDRELVVNIDGYEYLGSADPRNDEVPDLVVDFLAELLPVSWKFDNRGTRIEVHPSGRRYGGYHEDDIIALKKAVTGLLGREPEVVRHDT